jgi:hypothetical protein
MERVTTLLEANEVNDYQVADKVIARSVTGSPRFDTPVWPGYNVNITLQISDNKKASSIIELLKNFNKENVSGSDEFLTVCSWEMENYFFD